jgi:hypothetical protein
MRFTFQDIDNVHKQLLMAVAPCLPAGRYPAELRGLNRAAKLEKFKLLTRIATIDENSNSLKKGKSIQRIARVSDACQLRKI